jgi:hypothetical protein
MGYLMAGNGKTIGDCGIKKYWENKQEEDEAEGNRRYKNRRSAFVQIE